jgi:hypothetical protein
MPCRLASLRSVLLLDSLGRLEGTIHSSPDDASEMYSMPNTATDTAVAYRTPFPGHVLGRQYNWPKPPVLALGILMLATRKVQDIMHPGHSLTRIPPPNAYGTSVV